MKKIPFLMLIAGLLTISITLFNSCQQDELAKPDVKITARTHDCSAVCIDPLAPVYYDHVDSVRETAGPNYRQFKYTVHNTLTGFVLNWTYTATTPTPRILNFVVSGAGFTVSQSYTSACVTNGTSGSNTFTFTGAWAACGVVSFTANIEDCANLIKATKTGTYNLVGQCVTCGTESFTYTTADNLNITFSYNAGAGTGALTGATVEFTFPQVMNSPLNGAGLYVGADGKLYTVNNPTNQTVFTWTGDIGCTSTTGQTFAFSFLPDCSAPPANDGVAVIWTDTKVNGVSVKGNLTNIKYTGCPN